MIKTIMLVFVVAALSLAENHPAKPDTAAAARVSIPSTAVQIESNLYRYVDRSGKAWLYSRTPFGLSIREDTPVAQSPANDAQLVTITDLGDTLRFERKGPFGVNVWVSKKSELTDAEQVMLLREQLKNQTRPAENPAESAQRKQ